MTITQLTYVYVENGAVPPTCVTKVPTADLAVYLDQHVDDLLGRAERIPPARFITGSDSQRFQRLRTGNAPGFLTSAQNLARSLQSRMDNRMKRGFFVALRRTSPTGNQAAVLKLDVSDKIGAALEAAPGGFDLAAVKDFLDLPGDLQKGAVINDPRGAVSDVVVGADRWDSKNQYFLDALGILQHFSEEQSVKEAVAAVRKVAPGKVTVFLERLETSPPSTLDTFLNANKDVFPAQERADIVAVADQRPRPLLPLDPTHVPLSRTIQADGITIKGSPQELASKMRVVKRQGGWRITIDVIDEPRDRT